MDITYLVIGLAILVSSMATGFIIFRMQGMHLMPHFVAIILALVATLAAVVTGMTAALYVAVILQFVVTITAYMQLVPTLKDSFQTSPGYSAHVAVVTMLPVLALAGLLM
jgi:hypothetical protein